jgi:hypothetical protein
MALQPVADLLGCGDAFAGRDGVLDAGAAS